MGSYKIVFSHHSLSKQESHGGQTVFPSHTGALLRERNLRNVCSSVPRAVSRNSAHPSHRKKLPPTPSYYAPRTPRKTTHLSPLGTSTTGASSPVQQRWNRWSGSSPFQYTPPSRHRTAIQPYQEGAHNSDFRITQSAQAQPAATIPQVPRVVRILPPRPRARPYTLQSHEAPHTTPKRGKGGYSSYPLTTPHRRHHREQFTEAQKEARIVRQVQRVRVEKRLRRSPSPAASDGPGDEEEEVDQQPTPNQSAFWQSIAERQQQGAPTEWVTRIFHHAATMGSKDLFPFPPLTNLPRLREGDLFPFAPMTQEPRSAYTLPDYEDTLSTGTPMSTSTPPPQGQTPLPAGDEAMLEDTEAALQVTTPIQEEPKKTQLTSIFETLEDPEPPAGRTDSMVSG